MIDTKDLLIEAYPPNQKGGQHVGTGSRGIKITHLPSGLIAISDFENTPFKNKDIALNMILGGLTSMYYKD